MEIKVFYDEISFRLRNKKKSTGLIIKVIRSYSLKPGDLSFIFTSDRNLIEINKEFLQHNYNTDVIAFGEVTKGIVNGEIYISVDNVRSNANNYKVSLNKEILRVMIHGTLHLCGLTDEFEDEKEEMHRIEDFWLNEYLETE